MEKDSTISIDPNSSTDSTRGHGEASGGEEVSTDSATYATTKTSMGSNSSSSANQSASSNDISINLDGNSAQKLDDPIAQDNTHHIEPNSSSSEFKTLGCGVKAESMIVKTNSFNTQDDNEEDFEDMEEYDDDDDDEDFHDVQEGNLKRYNLADYNGNDDDEFDDTDEIDSSEYKLDAEFDKLVQNPESIQTIIPSQSELISSDVAVATSPESKIRLSEKLGIHLDADSPIKLLKKGEFYGHDDSRRQAEAQDNSEQAATSVDNNHNEESAQLKVNANPEQSTSNPTEAGAPISPEKWSHDKYEFVQQANNNRGPARRNNANYNDQKPASYRRNNNPRFNGAAVQANQPFQQKNRPSNKPKSQRVRNKGISLSEYMEQNISNNNDQSTKSENVRPETATLDATTTNNAAASDIVNSKQRFYNNNRKYSNGNSSSSSSTVTAEQQQQRRGNRNFQPALSNELKKRLDFSTRVEPDGSEFNRSNSFKVNKSRYANNNNSGSSPTDELDRKMYDLTITTNVNSHTRRVVVDQHAINPPRFHTNNRSATNNLSDYIDFNAPSNPQTSQETRAKFSPLKSSKSMSHATRPARFNNNHNQVKLDEYLKYHIDNSGAANTNQNEIGDQQQSQSQRFTVRTQTFSNRNYYNRNGNKNFHGEGIAAPPKGRPLTNSSHMQGPIIGQQPSYNMPYTQQANDYSNYANGFNQTGYYPNQG